MSKLTDSTSLPSNRADRSPVLTSVSLDFPIGEDPRPNGPDQDWCGYCVEFLSNLPALTYLNIRMRVPNAYGANPIFIEETFDRLITQIRHEGLETLIILVLDGDVIFCHYWAVDLPNSDFAHFPKLRRIVTPDDFLFSKDPEFRCYNLPASVEKIEIVDPSSYAQSYAHHLAENKAMYPRLTQLVLWYRNDVWSGNVVEHEKLLDDMQQKLLHVGVKLHVKLANEWSDN
ncbi:hypothetical protein BDW02DRAFT_601381 [Decorospora gaudefroyi]|uniref:Uncharacterized protein n=1 Tax=Decorospora gaudefroyi TaxID=184978 RepID=A0A6A5K3V7_9PLEO|nr:hypothetical protein BDW02DRAFT_601381 [Decorospora gaudefroyi]